MKAVIVSGGTPPSKELLTQELADSSLLICADSGANCLYSYNAVPNILIGDFDSIDSKVFDHFIKSGCSVEKFSKEKDSTDSEICLDKAMEMGASEIVLLGSTGGRLDHTLGNIGLLKKGLQLNINMYLKDENNSVTMINRPYKITGKKGEYISFLAYSDLVEGLSIKGAKYPLENYNLALGDSLTVSNEFLKESIDIFFKRGILLIIKSKD